MPDQPLQLPSTEQLENSLALLVQELIAFRQRKPHNPNPKLQPISAATYANTNQEICTARAWANTPVDLALKNAMREIAQLILNQQHSLSDLRTTVEHVAQRHQTTAHIALAILNSALNGVSKNGHVWYS